MAHELERFSKSILSSPQLLSLDKFQELSEFFSTRNSGVYEETYKAALEANKLSGNKEDKRDLVESKVGVLRVHNNLVDKVSMWSSLCGDTSYRQLLEDTKYLCSLDEVEIILLDVDSGGGTAFNCLETSVNIRKLATESGKRLVTYIDGYACSAAYALACISDDVIMHGGGSCGSIGVVLQLLNDSKALEKEGYERTFITAGDSKVPFDKEGGYREEYIADVQKRVSELYDTFIDHVATMRDITPEEVRATQAKVYSAKDSLELGLIDKIMDPTEFYEWLASQGELTSPQQLRDHDKDDDEYMVNVAETQELNLTDKGEPSMSDVITAEALAAMQAKMEEQANMLATFQAKEQAAEKASLDAKLSEMSFLGEQKEAVLGYLLSADESNKALMSNVLEAAQAEQAKVMEDAAKMVADDKAQAEQLVNDANTKAEAAEQEALATKESFGSQDTIVGEPEGKTVVASQASGEGRTAQLEAAVQAELAKQKS